MAENDSPANATLDPAATDETTSNARDGARKRRDPNQPSAVVGLGASAGGIAALQQFFTDMSPESGLAFVVVMHLSPEHESNLAAVIQQKTKMPVTQVTEALKVKPNHVYVIPPNHQLAFEEETLRLVEPQQALGKRVTIDLFFRTLAMAFGQRAVCLIFSGSDSDGAIGVRHIRAQGGIVIAQHPSEAEYESMPLMAINTGMVDWVLPVAKMPAKLLEFVRNENSMRLPPEIEGEDGTDVKVKEALGGETVSDETRGTNDESTLLEVQAQDIDDLKRAQARTREIEERFALLVEGTPDYAMFLLDAGEKITYWSSGAEKVFGWSAAEAEGQSGDLIFTPEDKRKRAVEQEIAFALENGYSPDRRWHLRKDGSRLWVDGIMRRLDWADGSLRGFAKIARDATDQREIEDALRHAKDDMEQRVKERTRDLLATNNELERTMRQRQQLEKELLEISEREKRRIGEDLHDSVCQELTATALFLKSSASAVKAESAKAAEMLNESAEIVNRNVGLTRDLARGLQPADLKGAGLKDALRALAVQACESNTEMQCHFKAARGVRVHDDNVALHLYRVAQEAVKNAIKHSGAKNILISLDRNKEHTCVSVQDDGKGFSPKRNSKGLGLHIMRYRANALGGELKIKKRKTGGMDITCVIPAKR